MTDTTTATSEPAQPLGLPLNDQLGPLPEPAGFSAGTHDGALFTLKRGTGKNFAIGMRDPLCEWYSAEQMRVYAAEQVAAERKRLCAAIKAADDQASDGDYMLDSDDCISVIRGTWNPGA